MSFAPEHKPSPWGRIAAENARSSHLVPSDRFHGSDPAIDADVLRVSVDLDPAAIAGFADPGRPSEVIRLLTVPAPGPDSGV